MRTFHVNGPFGVQITLRTSVPGTISFTLPSRVTSEASIASTSAEGSSSMSDATSAEFNRVMSIDIPGMPSTATLTRNSSSMSEIGSGQERCPSPTPTEIIEDDLTSEDIVARIKSKGIKVRDFAYTPYPTSGKAFETFDAARALLSHDVSIVDPGRTKPMLGKDMRRLLDMEWVSMEEAQESWEEMDWRALEDLDKRDEYPWKAFNTRKPSEEERLQYVKARVDFLASLSVKAPKLVSPPHVPAGADDSDVEMAAASRENLALSTPCVLKGRGRKRSLDSTLVARGGHELAAKRRKLMAKPMSSSPLASASSSMRTIAHATLKSRCSSLSPPSSSSSASRSSGRSVPTSTRGKAPAPTKTPALTPQHSGMSGIESTTPSTPGSSTSQPRSSLPCSPLSNSNSTPPVSSTSNPTPADLPRNQPRQYPARPEEYARVGIYLAPDVIAGPQTPPSLSPSASSSNLTAAGKASSISLGSVSAPGNASPASVSQPTLPASRSLKRGLSRTATLSYINV